MPRDVVCFDLDGTLLDPNGSIRDALDHAVATGGHAPFAPEDILIGMPLRDILRHRTQDTKEIDALVKAFQARYLAHGWTLARYYPGFPAAVETLRDEGFQTAIVTTKGEEEAEILMENLGHRDLWDTIVGDDGVRPLKPRPEPVIAACGRLGRRPQDAVMVGDTSFDIDAGRAAGAHTLGVTWGTGWEWGAAPDEAHAIVTDAEELLARIRDWAQGATV